MKKLSLGKKIIIGVGIFLTILVAVLYLITHSLMLQNFGRAEYSKYSYAYRYDFYEDDYERRAVEFESGDNTLHGYVYGEENDKALIVFSHGIGNGHEGYINEIIWFVDNGYRVFAFDNTGSCESEGKGTTGLSQSALDLQAALTYIENDNELKDMKKLLVGHSWGGFAVSAVLNFEHKVDAVASIAGYAYPVEMITEFGYNLMGDWVNIAYPFICVDNWLTFGKYANLSAIDGINKNDTPVLIIHGTNDATIGYDTASIISEKDKITNKNVEYLTISEPVINGHSSIFYSRKAADYRTELKSEYEKLSKKYPDGIPEELIAEFYDNIDYKKANEVNEKMLIEIDAFFNKNFTE